MKRCDVVFLVPGFLGFERFDDYAYFAERCAVVLRALLSEHARASGLEVRVVPVPIPPTASLATRQRALGKTLVRRAQAIGRADNLEIGAIHLVGHSAGGVDAELLTYERPLSPLHNWSDFDGVDVGWLRERLRSVISLASPHQGTCLALDAVARLLASGDARHLFGRVKPAFKELVAFASVLPELLADAELPKLVVGVLDSTEGRQFLHDLWSSRELIADLTPQASASRRAAAGTKRDVLRRSFVTIAAATPTATHSALDCLHDKHAQIRPAEDVCAPSAPAAAPDGLFLLLASLTSGRARGGASSTAGRGTAALCGPLQEGSVARLAQVVRDPERVITASADLLPREIDAAINDGIVNSVRQFIDPRDPEELSAVVVADHFDVIGHYNRTIWVTDPRGGPEQPETIVSGILHSGSEFRDKQFFALFDRIAACLTPVLGVL